VKVENHLGAPIGGLEICAITSGYPGNIVIFSFVLFSDRGSKLPALDGQPEAVQPDGWTVGR